MKNNVSVIKNIQDNYNSYTKAERKVGDVILENPQEAMRMSLGKIANSAKVSDPTVIRFCRLIGFEGYTDFKFNLTFELANSQNYVRSEVSQRDDASVYIEKIVNSSVKELSNLVDKLDNKIIESAVLTLSNATRIEFWGFGASGAVAQDIYHKFFRLGIPCIAYSDSHMQCMSASTLTTNSVIVAISHTGKSKELIDNVKLARESGAIVIGVTSTDSPLSNECTQVIAADLDEDTSIYTPMVSRLIHLLILDVLVVGVSLQKGEQLPERLKNMKEALKKKRI